MRKSKKTNMEPIVDNITLLNYNSSEYINQSSLEYSISTVDRMIAGIDGLKNSQRKGIFILSKISGEIKTISCAGRMISEGIYLHGDVSASGTLQQMASPIANNYPLIGKRGGFGTQVNPAPASPRYTYVKKNKTTEQLVLRDLDIVPMQENYDGTTMEPVHFLPIIPLALLGSDGLAVGYKSVILPYQMKDIIANTLRVIDKKEPKEMTPYYVSYGANEYVEKREDGKYTFFGTAEVIDASTVRITGLPPRKSLEKFIEKLIDMEVNGEIRNYVDDSTGTIDVTIKLPRGMSANWDDMDVCEFFGLQTKIAQALVVLGENGKVKIYDNTSELIKDFVAFRFKFYIKRYEKLLADACDLVRFKILVQACFENDMLSHIKSCKNRSDVVAFVTALNEEIEASDENIQSIVNYPSYRWTQEALTEVQAEIASTLELIDQYEDMLANESKIWDVYREEVEELKKHDFTPVRDDK